MIIRPATPEDVMALRDIVERAYSVYIERIGRRPGPMDDDYTQRLREADVFVAEESGGALAGLIVLVPAADHLLIDNVAVDPDRQGDGVGRALLDHAEQFALECDLDEVRLYTNVAMVENQSIYRHLGYRENGRRVETNF